MYFKNDTKKIWGFIYKFTINEKIYVGLAINLKRRFKTHFKEVKSNPYFHNALRKYFKSRDFRIIEAIYETKKNLKLILTEREIFWINKLDTYDPKQKKGWNLTRGGEGQFGWNPSEVTRDKMSNAKKGKPNGRKGIPFSKEHIENISKYHANVSGENNPKAKNVILISPDGIEYRLPCYVPFCKKYELDRSSICCVLQGKRENYKGWTGRYLNAE